MVHGIAVTEPVCVRTRTVAKALAAELALKALADESSVYHLAQLCDCNAKGGEVNPKLVIGEEEERDSEGEGEGQAEPPVQKDETEEGFAVLARDLLEAREGRFTRVEVDAGEPSDMDISEDEVEVL